MLAHTSWYHILIYMGPALHKYNTDRFKLVIQEFKRHQFDRSICSNAFEESTVFALPWTRKIYWITPLQQSQPIQRHFNVLITDAVLQQSTETLGRFNQNQCRIQICILLSNRKLPPTGKYVEQVVPSFQSGRFSQLPISRPDWSTSI